jgi:carbonic anhydrase/acetyltransferase-like protein (isoleucine patch superfamily)
MGSVVGEGAVVESGAFVAAGAVVAPGSVVKAGELWGGNPAAKLRALTPKEVSGLQTQADEYVKLAAFHAADLKAL